MIRFHKEGYRIILTALIISIIGVVCAEKLIEIPWLVKLIQIVILGFLIIILQFFRNPKRIAPLHNDILVAPVDGKVVVIEEVEEPEYFKGKRLQVSIFMSPINVHVTRYAMSGEIKYSKYHPGKYLVAWHPKSSELNERTTIVLKNDVFGEVLYRQIAGAVARRIVNYAKEHRKDENPFLILTECGIASRLQVEHPDLNLVGSCMMCRYMKSNSLEGILL